MRFSVPITITKAGAPITPHLVKQHIGGSFNNDYLGIMLEDGSIKMLSWDGNAIPFYDNNTIRVVPNFGEESFEFGDLDPDVVEDTAGEFDWLEFGTSCTIFGYQNIYTFSFHFFDSSEEIFDLVLYDFVIESLTEYAFLPISEFIEQITIDPETAYVTACDVDGFRYLALSVNGIVRPIVDIGGNMGSEMTADEAAFYVTDCSHVRAAGEEIHNLPAQISFTNYWSARSCSVDQGNVTTALKASVMMLEREWLVLSQSQTKPAGDWYIPTSQFTVNEA